MTEPKNRGRPKKPQRKDVPLHVFIPPDLATAIRLVMQQTRRIKTTEVVMALEEHCKKHGVWPLPPDAAARLEAGDTKTPPDVT